MTNTFVKCLTGYENPRLYRKAYDEQQNANRSLGH
jgi:hypothetical protein